MQYYERIENVRDDNDIKQYELAGVIGIDKKTYCSYEKGSRGIPLKVLDKVALALNISLDYILGLRDEKSYANMKNIKFDSIGIRLKRFRKKLGLSQTQFANNVNIKQQTISNYETGKSIFTVDNLIIICSYYKISADLLTGRINKKVKIDNRQLQK